MHAIFGGKYRDRALSQHRIVVPAFRHVLITMYLETSRRQIVVSATVSLSERSSSRHKLSVGCVGDSHDNALANAIKDTFETEVIQRHGPRRSIGTMEQATHKWPAWPNKHCLREPIGNNPPAEAEVHCHAALETKALQV